AAGMAVEGSGKEHVAARPRVEALHIFLLTANRGDRKAVGDGFPHRRDIGGDTADSLVAADMMSEARDNLVEDENHTFLIADLTEALKKFPVREDATHVVWDWFKNNAGDLIRVVLDRPFDVLKAVEPAHQRILDRFLQHSGRTGVPFIGELRRTDH